MKKILLTTALLTASAGMAAAEVTFSGYGRFGIEYYSGAGDNVAKTTIFQRLRFNINAKTETDSGVTFGGRIRLQSDSGRSEATLNTAYVYASYEGFRLEVGNSNTAVDSAALAFNSEIGIQDFGAGDPLFGNYYEYNSRSQDPDRMGVFLSYSVGDFNGRVSYVQTDQYDTNSNDDEIALSADYKFGPVTVSGAYASNGAGIEDLNYYFVGAEYAVSDVANVGLLYFGVDDTGFSGNKVTLYGNYKFDAITVKGYVSALDGDYNPPEDTAFGIGVDYDLGGGRLAAGIERGFDGETYADAGVRFDF